jgi:uncharacterized repeat protein (TIGR03803 family)
MRYLFFGAWIGAVGYALGLPLPATAIAASTETVVYSFCSKTYCTDGAAPMAGLIEVDGTLFGTTEGGGAHCTYFEPPGCGTAFSVNPTTGANRVYSFKPRDGAWTAANLIDVKGMLYGVTSGRGAYGAGTAFRLNPSTGAETVLHSFGDGADGASPWANVIDVKGTLYGTTCCGGANGTGGTVFAVNARTGAETVLHSFGGDGAGLFSGLIDVKGVLYGTTVGGGTNCTAYAQGGCGTMFSIDPTTGAETVIYSFCSLRNCKDGASPSSGLIDVNGILYGTTFAGGTKNPNGCYNGGGFPGCGTVFSIDPGTGVETVLHSFQDNGKDGWQPDADLMDVKGALYGTTDGGGSGDTKACGNVFGYGCGTVFSLDMKNGKEKVLYSFCSRRNCTDGAFPLSNLIAVKGVLYGTTENGGANCFDRYGQGCGTVFAITNP